MSVNFNDLAITSLETLTAFDIVTGEYLWTLDELQNATISNTQETTDITGKQGRLLNTLKRNKAVTISGNNGMISGGLMATQTGGEFEEKAGTVLFPEVLVVTGNKATTTYKATGTAGNEIDHIEVKTSTGTVSKTLTQDTSVAAGKFTYSPDSRELAFNEGDIEDGTEINVYYFRKINASVMSNLSDNYSKKAALYLDCFAEDKCANVYRLQFYFPQADFNGNFDIQMGDSQAVHAFEARSLAGACTAAGALWTVTIFGEDASDAA